MRLWNVTNMSIWSKIPDSGMYTWYTNTSYLAKSMQSFCITGSGVCVQYLNTIKWQEMGKYPAKPFPAFIGQNHSHVETVICLNFYFILGLLVKILYIKFVHAWKTVYMGKRH